MPCVTKSDANAMQSILDDMLAAARTRDRFALEHGAGIRHKRMGQHVTGMQMGW
jgi:hypothetical protein